MKPQLIPVLFALALVAPVGAETCTPTTTFPVFTVHANVIGHPGYYLDIDGAACVLPTNACQVLVWVYEETNGIAGLQRQDEVKDDTCGGQIAGDTIRF